MIEIKTIEDFNRENNGQVVLKIGTSYCGPCKMVEENLKSIESSYPKVKFLIIDAEEVDELFLDSFGIRNVPVIIYYQNGVEVDRVVGMQTVEQIKTKLESYEI